MHSKAADKLIVTFKKFCIWVFWPKMTQIVNYQLMISNLPGTSPCEMKMRPQFFPFGTPRHEGMWCFLSTRARLFSIEQPFEMIRNDEHFPTVLPTLVV